MANKRKGHLPLNANANRMDESNTDETILNDFESESF